MAHEALLRRWPTLRRWHDQERAALEIQQEIARASSAWNQNARGADWLAHRGARLAEAEAVARREDFAAVFEGAPRDYLDAGREAEDAARDIEARRLARQRSMQRRVSLLLVVVALVTLVGGWLVVAGRRELTQQTARLVAINAKDAGEAGHYDRAMRLALVASQEKWLMQPLVDIKIQLGRAAHFSRLEAQLTGHEGTVTSATFSPDGARIVTSSVDNTARVWSRGEDGAWHSVILEGHQGPVVSASFSRDKRIVTASLDKTARVWSQGKDGVWASVVLKGHQSEVLSASFSPDGARIVTASNDETARVWSPGENGIWQSIALEGHQGFVSSASFSPDGTHIVTAARDNTVRIWSQGKDGDWQSVALEGHQGYVASASFSPDGTRIVTASFDNTARVRSAGTDSSLHTPQRPFRRTASASSPRRMTKPPAYGAQARAARGTASLWIIKT